MTQKHSLADVSILIVDSDYQMAQVLRETLHTMGFIKTQHVASGSDALKQLHQSPVDLLITEWQTGTIDGVSLATQLRSLKDYHNRSFPVVMMTGRVERSDVEAARDAGITEYVAKPFTSKTVFSRLEEVTDRPRPTLLVPNYTGPDRRRKKSETVEDRRECSPQLANVNALGDDRNTPKMALPDFALRTKMGILQPLSTVITPAILAKAQDSIDMLKDESLAWVQADIGEAERCHKKMLARADMDTLQEVRNLLLSIKSRAGTFGYLAVSEAADIAYRFMRNDYSIGQPQHLLALEKCLEALRVLLVTPPHAESEKMKTQLINELRLMGAKFQQGGA